MLCRGGLRQRFSAVVCCWARLGFDGAVSAVYSIRALSAVSMKPPCGLTALFLIMSKVVRAVILLFFTQRL